MLVCVGGDIHGALNRFYDDVLSLETSIGIRFDWVLHVGDFGIWPLFNSNHQLILNPRVMRVNDEVIRLLPQFIKDLN